MAEAIRVSTPRDKCNDAFGSGHAAPPRGSLGEIMRTKIQRLVLLVMLVGGLLVALSTPANAATNQISGEAVYDTTPPSVCLDPPPPGYEDSPDPTSGDNGGSGRLLVHETRDIQRQRDAERGVHRER